MIQTNVAWVFLALCNHKVTGFTMLEAGITREMFMISCNSDQAKIRDIIITGFAQLGKCDSFKAKVEELETHRQRMKETSLIKIQEQMKNHPQKICGILVQFAASKDRKYQQAAYWAIKEYLIQTNESDQIALLQEIIEALTVGVTIEDPKIQADCATALAYLVTQRHVYISEITEETLTDEIKQIISNTKKQPCSHVLDALMLLSGNECEKIKAIAFSSLSLLSQFSANCPHIYSQIMRDV